MSITLKSILAKIVSLGLIAGLLAISTVVSVSNDKLPMAVTDYYNGLQTADAKVLTNILDDKASIELKDLGFTQTKAEFIASLDEWKNANENAIISYKPHTNNKSITVVNVCYKFPTNEVYSREAFTITNEKIVKSVQEKISNLCE